MHTSRPDAVARAFLVGFSSAESLEETFNRTVTDDFVFESSGFPTMKGRDGVLQFFDAVQAATEFKRVEVEVAHFAVDGDTVLAERIDRMYGPEDEVMLTFEIMCRLDVRDTRVSACRLYFDPMALLDQMQTHG